MTAPSIIIHVPHASTVIPKEVRLTLCLTDDELQHELLLMTDWYTNDLFALPQDVATTVLFPVSRLVVDPERFVDNDCEPMASKGMGAIYSRTSDGRALRQGISSEERERLLNTYYHPHQRGVRDAVNNSLEVHGRCLLVDAHSFSSMPLPHEPYQSSNRCQVCIGTDDFHTPPHLVEWLAAAFEKAGFVVAVNRPFSGTFVPTGFYHRNRHVSSVMIEVNRSLYMDEETGDRHTGFGQVQARLTNVLMELTTTFVLPSSEDARGRESMPEQQADTGNSEFLDRWHEVNEELERLEGRTDEESNQSRGALLEELMCMDMVLGQYRRNMIAASKKWAEQERTSGDGKTEG